MAKILCIACRKEIIHPDTYGDYDDACEWSCRCGGYERTFGHLEDE